MSLGRRGTHPSGGFDRHYNVPADATSGAGPRHALSCRMHACIPNIGPARQRRRLRLGAAGLIVAVVLAAALAAADAHPALHTLIALPLYSAALGFFQHREKT